MAEGTIGARLLLIGKTAFLGGLSEVQAKVAAVNKANAASTKASAAEQAAAYEGLTRAQIQGARRTAEGQAAMLAVGKKAAIGLGAVAALTVYEGLRIHSQFQSAMLQTVNLAGVSQNRLAALTAGIKQLSPAVNQGLVPLANALYRVASTPAGLKASNAELLNMVRYAGELATIGGPGTNLEQTARVIGSASTVGVKGTGSPKNIVDLAAATVGSGDIRMSDFVSFMGTGVLTSGKLTGVTMPQMGAFLALAGSNLMSGQVSGHGLAHGLMMMAAPNLTAEKAFGSVGLSPFQLGDTMRNHGLGAGVHQLYDALNKPLGPNANVAQLGKYGFSAQDIAQAQAIGMGKMGAHGQTLMTHILTRAFGGARMGLPLNLLNAENKQYDSTLKHIQKEMRSGIVDKAMARQLDSLSGKTGQFTKSLANLADTIGAVLTPAVKLLLTVGTKLADFFANNKLAALGLATVVTAVLGPAIGIYLKDRFLAAGGAMSKVIGGYKNLILGTYAEDTALASNDASLVANDAAITTNTGELVANNRARSGGAVGLVKKIGGGSGVVGLGALAIPAAAGFAIEQGLAGPFGLITHKPTARDRAVYNASKSGLAGSIHSKADFNDLRGLSLGGLHLGGLDIPHGAAPSAFTAPQQQIHTHVYINGKEILKSVQTQTKKAAARQ